MNDCACSFVSLTLVYEAGVSVCARRMGDFCATECTEKTRAGKKVCRKKKGGKKTGWCIVLMAGPAVLLRVKRSMQSMPWNLS